MTWPAVRPANDDRRSAGEILRSLQSRQEKIPAALVAVCSVLWIVLSASYVVANRATLFDLPVGALLPQAALYLMAIAGPVVFLALSVALLRRGQDMRLAAKSMTDVAIRLAEPETIATEQIVTLSQAIRREVASMGDGIERALARTSELETLVRSEVSNLERSYADNERRVRALVDELAGERESILTNADRVRGVIALAQENVTRDLSGASARFFLFEPSRRRDSPSRLESRRNVCPRGSSRYLRPRPEESDAGRRDVRNPGASSAACKIKKNVF